jgi:hypothetical protein
MLSVLWCGEGWGESSHHLPELTPLARSNSGLQHRKAAPKGGLYRHDVTPLSMRAGSDLRRFRQLPIHAAKRRALFLGYILCGRSVVSHSRDAPRLGSIEVNPNT